MKRLKGKKYFWTDHGESFITNYYDSLSSLSWGDEEYGVRNLCMLLEEVYEPYSTHDYAVDSRSMFSSIIQELLK